MRLSLLADGITDPQGKPLEIARAELRATKSGQLRVQTTVSEGRVFRLTVCPTDGVPQTLWEVTL